MQASQQTIIRIAVPTPLRRTFDYLCPSQQIVPIGARVLVSFGRQQLVGLVLEHPQESELERAKLKPIIKQLDQEPILDGELFKLIRWAAKYYQHPIGDVIANCLPTLLNKGEAASLQAEYEWVLTEQGEQAAPASNAVKQQQILLHAKQFANKKSAGKIEQSQLTGLNFSAPDLDKLVAKGWFTKQALSPRVELTDTPTTDSLNLNDEQQHAVETINNKLNSFHAYLLDGVTGSGKTEVYLQVIEQVIAQGKQVILLVPEIGLTPQTLKRLEARFNQPISMLHSGLSDRKRLNIWLKAKQGLTSIIIGTRSALFTPLKNPGLIVLDEEHDLSYKQQEGFRYSARDLAMMRAQLEATPIILGSATPSMESMHNLKQGKLEHLLLRKRAGKAKPPHLKIFDVRQRHLQDGLSQPLIEHIKKHLAQGNQCLIFLNRRGFAPSILCHDCGWLADCERCDRHMTYHQKFRRLHCHHCDKQLYMPKQCPSCQSDKLLPVGLGTERLEERLQALFPDKNLVRVDRDTTRRKDAMNQFVQAIKNDEVDILIGTQMLAKGHHFPKLTLVGVIDVDGCLFSADFRATERTAQLLTQVAGRAGRAEQKGEVVIQTHHPEHPLLVNLFTQDYQTLSTSILQERQTAKLPPFSAMSLFRADAAQLSLPMEFLQQVAEILKQYPQIGCFGPFPAPMTKRAGKMRAQLLIQADDKRTLQRILNPVIPLIETIKAGKKVRWSLDVDPQEVF